MKGMTPEYGNVKAGLNRSRSTFNVSEPLKTTFNANYLIPVYWDFLYPNEIRKGKVNCFIRMSNPLEYPLMDNAYITFHWFADAIRNQWDNFRKFYGEREDPGDSIDYSLPELGSGNDDLTDGSVFAQLCDHLDLPHTVSFDLSDAHALPFRMYNRVWNYWYRDQQLQDSINESTDDGPDAGATDYALKLRGKRFDYFTSGTIAPQRGDSVTIGGHIETGLSTGGQPTVKIVGGQFRALDSDAAIVDVSATSSSTEANKLFPNTTINELRNAVAVQQFLELDNRMGTRFPELIRAHWGAQFNDIRYAPVYLGGGRAPFNVTPITNTAKPNTADTSNLGELGAIGTNSFEGASFTYAADEPMIIMCIASVHADQHYHQGLNRKWSYRTRYDLMWPEFQGIGDQATLLKEVYYQNTGDDENVFHYLPRYEECRVGKARLAGEFRPDNALTLETWHLAQDLVGPPTYNTLFIESAVPMGRVLQSTVNNHFIAEMYIEQFSTKELSLTGIPGLARL